MQSSLRTQLTTALVAFTVVPLLVLGIWLSWNNYVLEKRQLINFQTKRAEDASKLMLAFFHEKEDKIKSIIGTNYIPSMSLEKKRELLSKHLHADKDNIHREAFTEFSLLNSDGNEIVRVAKKYLISNKQVDMSNTDEFIIPFQKKVTYYSPIYFDELSGEPLMKIGFPLIELRNQTTVGVLTGEIRLNFFHNIIAGIKIGKTGSAYLTDKNGHVVVHPNPSIVLKGSMFLTPSEPSIMTGLNGRKAIVVAQKMTLGNQQLFCVTEVPTLEAYDDLVGSIVIILTVLLLSLSCSVTVGIIFIRKYVKPIEQLADTAKSISQGNLHQQVTYRRDDEIGQLASSFGTMTEKLLSTIKDIKKEKDFIRNAIEALTQPFFVVDANDYTVKLANSAASLGTVSGRETCYALLHGADAPCHTQDNPCPVELIKKTGKPVTLTLSREHIGVLRTFDVHGYPVYDEEGNLSQVIEYHIDITEKIKLEEQLRHSQKMETIGTLAGGIAHDFNNILTLIHGYAQMVHNAVKHDSALAEDVEEIITAGARARDLVRQILTISRKNVHKKNPLVLSPIVKEVVKMLRSTLPSNIKIHQKLESQSMVLAEPSQVHQIIMNLCTNAYHEMRQTGGVLSISLEDVDISDACEMQWPKFSPGKYVKLVVSDTGRGIDEAMREKIFEPYYTTKEAGDGTGLGLAVVYGIVQDYDGHIMIHNKKRQGATFTVFLPCYSGSIEVFFDESATTTSDLTGTETIMFVDDEEKIVNLAKKNFLRHGYSIQCFTNGRDAIEEFRRHPDEYALIITDMAIPDVTGDDIAKTILQAKNTTPVILCTGFSDLIDREKALKMGISEFVEKPFSMKSLLQVVRSVLDGKQGTAIR